MTLNQTGIYSLSVTPAHSAPNQSRSLSTTVSPRLSSGGNLIQCSGITMKGKRCKCAVKSSLALLDTGAGVERFCHQHINSLSATPAHRPPNQSRSLSAFMSLTSSSGGNQIRCSGITRGGKRCLRDVKSSLALLDTSPDAGVRRFCYEHLNQTGIYS
jgi:hypothetical protein